jgi:L-serine dehydratase
MFVSDLQAHDQLYSVARIRVELYGSLGATGKGHGTDKAVILGLEGEAPDTVNTDDIPARLEAIRARGQLALPGKHELDFEAQRDLIFHKRKVLPYHPNGMKCLALDSAGQVLRERSYYSVGGGFVVNEAAAGADRIVEDRTPRAFPFSTGAELLSICSEEGLSISQVMLQNELAWRSEAEIRAGLVHIWEVMQACVARGCHTEGVLPGGLKVKRRAARLYRQLTNESELDKASLGTMDWVNLYALAVNEENAAGGRVVTAPTNGAAGIIPAVLHYYWKFAPGFNDDGVVRFLLAAGAIGILYKENASISGAEVGCQGEVGSACSMAAAALTEVLGGTPGQVENAAEIAMEHNLGLTCDPVGGLVQVPCIERNAMGAVKAINASRMAMRGDGTHFVSLDKVIKTMRDTGADMKTKYKETARGGLAVNVIEC